MELFNFHFVGGDEENITICVLVNLENEIENRATIAYKIEDAISSYIEAFDEWKAEQMVCEILDSFYLNYKILDQTNFYI